MIQMSTILDHLIDTPWSMSMKGSIGFKSRALVILTNMRKVNVHVRDRIQVRKSNGRVSPWTDLWGLDSTAVVNENSSMYIQWFKMNSSHLLSVWTISR